MSFNRTFVLILTFFLTGKSLGHDFKMAIYEIYESEGGYSLNIKFDIADLKKSVFAEYEVDQNQWQLKVEEYVRKHFYLKFNNEFAVIRFSGMTAEKDFLVVEATLHDVLTPIKKIDVFSTCLINEVEGHSNLIQANLYGTKRYFRLSKDRIKTLIDY